MREKFKLEFKRKELEKFVGKNILLEGTFSRFGHSEKETKEPGTPMLITRIKHNGEDFSDHVWVLINDEFKDVEIDNGDRIQFMAKVGTYVSGMPDFKLGYKLENVRDPKVIKKSKYNPAALEDIKFIKAEMKRNVSMLPVKKARQNKLRNRYEGHKATIDKLLRGDFKNIYFILDKITENGDICFKYAFSDQTHIKDYKSGAVFNHYEKNKIIINETAVIEIPQDKFTSLSNLYFKIFNTKTDIVLPMELSRDEIAEIKNNNI